MPKMTLTSRLSTGLFSLLSLGLFCASIAAAQQRQDSSSPGFTSGPLNVEVSVRESTGGLLSDGALVRLRGLGMSFEQIQNTRDAGTAVFQNVNPGEYEVEVQAIDHKTALEQINVAGPASTYRVYVFVQPEGEPNSTASSIPTNGSILSPKLQELIDKGLDKMRKKEFEAAEESFAKAAKLAPGNSDIAYLWGMAFFALQRKDEAKQKFELSISLRPTQARALVALGELQLGTGDAEGAARNLEKAFQVDGADWKTHYLLAYAYVKTKQYPKAEEHAARASELAKERGATARLLLGKIQIAEGKMAEGKQTLEDLQRSFPAEPAAKIAAKDLEGLRKAESDAAIARTAPEKANAIPVPVSPAIEPPPPITERVWAPPDIDSKEYPIALGIACKQDEILASAQRRMKQQLGNFEKFGATEHIEHIPIDAHGIPGPAKTKDFSYLVFVRHVNKDLTYLDESRNGGQRLEDFPTQLVATGLVSVGVALFDKYYQTDFDYTCEGLGQWHGRPAWLVHWVQREDRPSRVMIWKRGAKYSPVAMRGRAWLAANTYDLLHLETDLREPVKELELTRDHLAVDYGAVKFNKANGELWLPGFAEMFLEVNGKRYHYKHTLTNYVLFSVDTTHKTGAPKQSPPSPEEH